MEQQKPSLRYREYSIVVPGDRIGTIIQVRPGTGTYLKGGHIHACLAGRLRVVKDVNDDTTTTNTKKNPTYICIIEVSSPSNLIFPATSQVVRVGQLIVGRVKRITAQNAIVEILVAEGVGPLRGPPYFEGAVRIDDVRSGKAVIDKTSVVIGDCFRPGDLVKAKIISMGDSRRYFLSTAATELGVIRGRSGNDNIMIPISFKEMECPKTGIREPRKCANVVAIQKQQ